MSVNHSFKKKATDKTLETIAGVCDGRTIKGESGIYTLPAVTQPQESADGSPWTELTGSKISYKPPTGTKQVIYKLHIHISELNLVVMAIHIVSYRQCV